MYRLVCVVKPLGDETESDPLAPMITWKDFQRLMPWEIVILVGGGYALAAGCKVLLKLRLKKACWDITAL